MLREAQAAGVPATHVGKVEGDRVVLGNHSVPLAAARSAHELGFSRYDGVSLQCRMTTFLPADAFAAKSGSKPKDQRRTRTPAHVTMCRRHSGALTTTWVELPAGDVTWTGARRRTIHLPIIRFLQSRLLSHLRVIHRGD